MKMINFNHRKFLNKGNVFELSKRKRENKMFFPIKVWEESFRISMNRIVTSCKEL